MVQERAEAAQLAWIEAELAPAATRGATHVVVLSHIAPFMGSEDEPTGRFIA
jgi:3',5'-cyclic AMP phosphodiesterase CpdA